MIKVDIVNEVSKVADITKVKAEVAVDAVFDAMRISMQRGERIELRDAHAAVKRGEQRVDADPLALEVRAFDASGGGRKRAGDANAPISPRQSCGARDKTARRGCRDIQAICDGPPRALPEPRRTGRAVAPCGRRSAARPSCADVPRGE